jgi:hypothetical protein
MSNHGTKKPVPAHIVGIMLVALLLVHVSHDTHWQSVVWPKGSFMPGSDCWIAAMHACFVWEREWFQMAQHHTDPSRAPLVPEPSCMLKQALHTSHQNLATRHGKTGAVQHHAGAGAAPWMTR